MKYFNILLLCCCFSVSGSAQLSNNLLPEPRQTNSTNHNNNTSTFNNEIHNWITKVLNSLGANSILDGDPKTNQGPLQGPLNSKTPSSAEARHYMNFAGSAYCPRNLETWDCPWCLQDYKFKGVIVNETIQTLVFFAVSEIRKEIVVSYRGSQNLMNFAMDENSLAPVVVDSNSSIKLHGGFKEMTDSLFPQVLLKLSEFPEDYKIIFTGHSLGAAQASISVFYLYHSDAANVRLFNNRTIELFAYAAPRVGNQAFANFMNSLPIKIGRIVARADIIPRINSPAALGYYHFQREIWIYDVSGNGTDKNCSVAVYEDPNCSDSMGPLYTMADHVVYYHVNIMLCYVAQDPVVTLLQFILPLKSLIPSSIMNQIPIFQVQENSLVANFMNTVPQLVG